MTAQPAVTLERGPISARVLPDEGGVLIDLLVDGRPVLASTPWAANVLPAPTPDAAVAPTEDDWVARWRGGWQLCFPTAGQPNPRATVPEGFHGAASQAPWLQVARTADSVALGWADRHGLSAERIWRLTDSGAAVAVRVRNDGPTSRPLAIAEHLILGGSLLAAPLSVAVPPGAVLRELDYAGLPTGRRDPWPGDPGERWAVVDAATPARVVALENVAPQRITLAGAHATVIVEWQGEALPHALLWEELAVSTDPPWNAQVRALGIEPTSTPHGAGTALDEGILHLPTGGELAWSVTLDVAWASNPLPDPHPARPLESEST